MIGPGLSSALRSTTHLAWDRRLGTVMALGGQRNTWTVFRWNSQDRAPPCPRPRPCPASYPYPAPPCPRLISAPPYPRPCPALSSLPFPVPPQPRPRSLSRPGHAPAPLRPRHQADGAEGTSPRGCSGTLCAHCTRRRGVTLYRRPDLEPCGPRDVTCHAAQA